MKKSLVTLFIFLIVIYFNGAAQSTASELEDALGFDQQVNDSQAAPIDSSIYVLVVFGSCLGLWQLRKKKS